MAKIELMTLLGRCLVVILELLGTGEAAAQTYPVKPIRLITSGVGGGGDFTARLLAQGISVSLGQQVVVDNRASGTIPGEMVAKAQPDGYTLLLYGSAIWLAPYLQEKSPYDPIRDFLPITLAASSPNILVVHPSLSIKSVRDLINYAKAKPGSLNYASAAVGSSTHLAAELFKAMAHVNMVRINYKGAATLLNDLIGGQVPLSFATAGSVASHIQSGRLRALAVTSARPSTLAPDLPTVASAGLPGYESVSMSGVFAPARTPGAIISLLNGEMVRILQTLAAKERLFSSGLEVIGNTPAQLAVAMKSEMTRLGKVIRDAGIRAD